MAERCILDGVETLADLIDKTATAHGDRSADDIERLDAALNNVAWYGAFSFDPFTPVTTQAVPYPTLVLGGRTQVQRALEAAARQASSPWNTSP